MNPDTWNRLDAEFAEVERLAGYRLTRARETPSDDEVSRAAADLGCAFHDDYAAFLRRYGGATVGSLPVFGLRPVEATGEPWSVVEVTRNFRQHHWPRTEGWYVISDDGFGNAIGIAPDGRVMTTDHDAGGVHVLTNSFEEFLLTRCLRAKE
jgi:hypothetical protein